MADYEFLEYETDSDGITAITLNRPPANAFNRAMGQELLSALEKFANEGKERVLILTGTRRLFSAGEDLGNINLDWTDEQIADYAEKTLSQYHEIILAILEIGKPIIAALNGVAAGAGLSIALACDRRFVVTSEDTNHEETNEKKILFPSFSNLGLIADSGMMAILPKLTGRKEAQEWCEFPGMGVSIGDAIRLGLAEGYFEKNLFMTMVKFVLANTSSLAYALSKEMRNKALLQELNDHVFHWEIRAQTKCLQSKYFKHKAREFLARRAK